MNYLAHLYLADENDPNSLIGNLLADFTNPVDEVRYNPAIRLGIRRHRAIDRFTDHHPIFRNSTARIGHKYRLLKGILVDLFYDHFLARHWEDYHPLCLETFCYRVYTQLEPHTKELPERMQRMLKHMIRDNWLVSYRQTEGIEWALDRMSHRLSRPNVLYEGIEELHRHYNALEKDFQMFFPELVTYGKALSRDTATD